MLGVALRYGISLEDLQAANPEVDPRFLSVDTNLIIPLGESVPPALATPTPVQIRTEDPVCYRTSDLGAWCFFLVENILDEPLENVSARVYIVTANGGKVVEKTAYTPLNLIQPGSALPAMVYFEAPLAQDFVVGAEITSALLATGTNNRYLPVNLNEKYINIDQSGLTARLEGVISIPKYDEPGAFLRMVAIAYGAKGQIVGVRQHEIAHPQGTRSNLPFSMAVFSLGPHIERVEIFHEAIPQSVSSEETPTGN